MKRFSILFTFFAALFLLVACDGSSEPANQSNVLFVVAFQDKVGLVDGKTLIDDAIQEDSLFTWQMLTEGSKAVAFDFSNRHNRFTGRDEFFLLSRDENNQAYVSVFDMTMANIANEDGGLVAKRDAIKVDVELARAENVIAPSSLCVTDMQVSQSGQYIVLLSNQRACNDSSQESNAIDIIDIGVDLKAEPTLVYHKNLVMNIGENSQIFSNQSAERLVFLEGSAGQGTLRKLSLPEFKEETVLQNLNITNVIDLQSFANNSDEELIIARADNYAVVTNYLDTAILENAIPYGETVKQVFPNPLRPKERFFALTESEFLIFDTPTLENNVSASITAKDALYDPFNDYVYLLTDRNIRRYDVLGVFDVPSVPLENYNVSGLEDVQLFSWVREVLVTTTP